MTALDAARAYDARQNRVEHPDGEFDKAGRWYPSDDERQDCCSYVRGPSRAWPYSYMKHCRSAAHVAALYGVSERDLKRALYLLDRYPSHVAESALEVAAVAERTEGKELSTARVNTLAKRIEKERRAA